MNFEEFFNAYCGNSNPNNVNNTAGFGCDDVPGGFQDLDPELFTMLGSIIGTISARNLPFNLQNAIGNWLELVGQAILTYNCQQQYLQNGPGRYYDIRNKNVGNATCPSASGQSSSCNCQSEIEELKKQIKKLSEKIDKLEK